MSFKCSFLFNETLPKWGSLPFKDDLKINELKYFNNEVLEENMKYIVKNRMYEDVAFLDSIIVNLNKVSDSAVFHNKLYVSFIENLAVMKGKDLDYYSTYSLTMGSYVYGLSREKGPMDLLNFTMNSVGGSDINLNMFEDLTGEKPRWEIEGTPSEPLGSSDVTTIPDHSYQR